MAVLSDPQYGSQRDVHRSRGFQKTFRDDRFNKHINYGEKDMYRIESHHEPIVSGEVFRAANLAIKTNAREKGLTDGTKCSQRYALSGKIVCGECGAKWKRHIIDGEIWFICSTHLTESSKCSQLTVRSDALEAAFVNMMNKLTYGRRAVLVPLAGKLAGNRSMETLRRLAELDEEKEKAVSRRQDAEKFFIKGLLDAAVYTEEVDEFARRESEI